MERFTEQLPNAIGSVFFVQSWEFLYMYIFKETGMREIRILQYPETEQSVCVVLLEESTETRILRHRNDGDWQQYHVAWLVCKVVENNKYQSSF
jgi:hypothetical protein